MKWIRYGGFGCLIIAVVCVGLLSSARAADTIAEITAVEGRVDVLRNGKLPSEKAVVGMSLYVGDFVRTKSRSEAEVLFVDGNRISIKPRSRVDISTYTLDKDQRTLNLTRGKVEAAVVPSAKPDTSERPKRFEIHTPNAVAGIRGTRLVVSFQDNTTAILVKELHGGRSVYSLSKFHPEELFDIPAGGMMWVTNQGLPTTISPSSSLGFTTLATALQGDIDLGELLVLVDALKVGLSQIDVPLVTDAFPELIKPDFEVGTVSMSGNGLVTGGDLTVSMTSHFLALTPDTTPLEWWSDDVSLSWTAGGAVPYDPTHAPIVISGGNASTVAGGVFTVEGWDTLSGDWMASVTAGQGSVETGANFDFVGVANGTGASGSTGTGSGTALGLAGEMTMLQ